MRILITGSSGFLGSHLVAKLRARSMESLFLPRRADYDLTRYNDVARLYATARPHIVVHLAAVVGGIGANRANPGRFLYDNLMMGAHMLELGRLHGIGKFVAVGTTCSYPKFCPIPFKEDDIWNGYPEETNAPYGLAKKMLLAQVNAYREQYGMKSIYLIPTNLYGPGDNFDPQSSHVIPALIRIFAEAVRNEQSEVTLWGTGTATRDFLYVDDAAEAILLAMERYNGNEPVNLGSGSEISIRDLAVTVAELSNYTGAIHFDSTSPDGQPRRLLDTSRAEKYLNWRAATGLRLGLATTIGWYDQKFSVSEKHAFIT